MALATPGAPGKKKRRARNRVRAAALLAAVSTVVGLAIMAAGPASASSAGPAVTKPVHARAKSPSVVRLKPVVRHALRHDTSPPLRKMKPLKKLPRVSHNFKFKPIPLGIPPHVVTGVGRAAAGGKGAPVKSAAGQAGAAHPGLKDVTADVQRAATVTTANMPSIQQNFDGVSNLNGVLPPDTNMAVGPNDVVQTVNFSFAIYSKTGATLLGPETLSTLWQGFGGECDPSVDPAANGGDVVAVYDESANRFMITQLAYPQLELGSGGYHECIAVSQTGDPTGAWYRYDFAFSSNTLNDYPKWGVWPDAYYMSNNDFLDGQTFTGVTVTAFDRAEMLAGQAASDVQFTIGSQYGSLLPSNAEGGALGFNPPSGAPDPYWMSCDAANGGPCTSDQLDEWDFHVDWTNPANSTFGNNGSPTTTIPVATFDSNLCNYSRDCIPQPGTTQGLDALSDRLMYQAAYRNLGNGTDAVVFDQTVNVSPNPTTNPQAGIRWYEFTNSGSGWSLNQQGTYAPDSNNRWMGSANIDASGDIGIGYSVSSSTTFPSINVAGRLAGDPAGQLSQGEETMFAGSGSQTDPAARWGDYSAMQVDPTDGCTFWYTNEYLPSTSDDSWNTRIGSFSFPSCTAGAHGTLTGQVTDASTGNPIVGATVSTSEATTTTDSQGDYTMVLPAASYTETISAYGYGTDTINGVEVTGGGTTTENAALTAEPTVPVTGTVTDGSGHSWPLHASISIQGRPGGPIWTDPATGQYTVNLPENATYSLTVNTDLPGYQTVDDSIAVGSAGLTHNISVPVDQTTCNAPGYAFSYGTPALSENFDDYTGDGGTTPPPGWTIQDNIGNGEVWAFNNPEGRGNLTGGTGNFAVLNSDQYGAGASQDSSLITPVLNLSGDSNPVLQFHNDYFGYPGQSGSVDVSTDGGTTWTNVWQHTSDSVRGPDLETVPIPQAAGQSDVEVRFHFVSSFGWWWEVDDVVVHNQSCAPTPGGLVVGQVTDANTGKALNGAAVTDTDNTADHATTGPSADPAFANGYYWLFSSLTGSHSFTAALGGYQTGSQSVSVTPNGSTKANFALGAGLLTISPTSITTSQVLGNTTNNTMTIKNTGTAPANVKLVQQGGSYQILTEQGAPLRLIKFSDDDPASPGAYKGVPGDGTTVNAGPPSQPTWSAIAQYPSGIMDNGADNINGKEYSVGGLDDTFTVTAKAYVYDPTTNGWSAIANMPLARYGRPATAADNGKLYVSGGWDTSGNVNGETDVYDPTTNTWTTVAPDPVPVAAPGVGVVNGNIYLVGGCADSNCTASSAVEVYNPTTNTWSSAAPYPHGDSWESCGGIDEKLYCAGGTDGTNTYTDGYVYDPGSNSWSAIASLPIDLWGSAAGAANGLLVVSGGVTSGFSTVTNQGFAYDPTTNTWSAIPNAQFPVYRAGGSCGFYKVGGSTGGFTPQSSAEQLSGLTTCGTTNIPWMSESPTTMTIQPGQSVAVTVTLTATAADQVTQPGTYTAQIGFEQDTPYDVNPVDVTMNVTPPKSWGEIVGTLSGEGCTQTTAPLRGVVYADEVRGTTQFTLPTSTAGAYAFWGPRGAWSLQASALNWIPVTTSASIKAGTTLTVNITLRPVTC